MKHFYSIFVALLVSISVMANDALLANSDSTLVDPDTTVINPDLPNGMCGDSVMWVIEDGVLLITGTGSMYQFVSEDSVPYIGYRQRIESVMVDEGVTAIGDFAFSGFMSLKKLSIMGELTSIGMNAFYYCNQLSSITCWSVNPPAIAGNMVFYAVPASVNVYVQGASIDAYKASRGWSGFSNIQPIPGTEVQPNTVTIFGQEVVIDSTGVEERVDFFGDSTLVYDPEDNTLTFSSLNLEVGDSVQTAISYTGSEPLTIVLCDSSVIFADTVISSTADIIIKGEGMLIAEGVTPIVGAPTATIVFDSVSMYVRSLPSPAALRRRIRGIKQTDEDGGPALSGFASADFNKTSVTPPDADYDDVEETNEVTGETISYRALLIHNADGSKTVLTEFTLTPIADSIDALESTRTPATLDPAQPMYNILGMPVEAGYKGIVLQGGRKFVVL